MGFLDHSTNNIIVDAVLTDVGREKLAAAIRNNLNYICSETLADDLRISTDTIENAQKIELVEGVNTSININQKNYLAASYTKINVS